MIVSTRTSSVGRKKAIRWLSLTRHNAHPLVSIGVQLVIFQPTMKSNGPQSLVRQSFESDPVRRGRDSFWHSVLAQDPRIQIATNVVAPR